MANGHGGDRVPSNPAPVSGPGSLSQRTDGQAVRAVTGLPYGENQDLNAQQAMAPMAGTTIGTGQAGVPPAVPLQDMSPNLFDPTAYPERPLTTGVPFGPGAGPEALGVGAQVGPLQREKLLAALPALLRAAEYSDVSPDFRRIVSLVRGSVLG